MGNYKSTVSGFAVAEYESAEVAEETQRILNGLELLNQRIRVTFCIPGRTGEDVYSNVLAAYVSLHLGFLELATGAACCLPYVVKSVNYAVSHSGMPLFHETMEIHIFLHQNIFCIFFISRILFILKFKTIVGT